MLCVVCYAAHGNFHYDRFDPCIRHEDVTATTKRQEWQLPFASTYTCLTDTMLILCFYEKARGATNTKARERRE